MIYAATILPGLPPYESLPTAFPREWGYLGRDGTVVEINTETGAQVCTPIGATFSLSLRVICGSSIQANELQFRCSLQ
jgi:hypothetical protein